MGSKNEKKSGKEREAKRKVEERKRWYWDKVRRFDFLVYIFILFIFLIKKIKIMSWKKIVRLCLHLYKHVFTVYS